MNGEGIVVWFILVSVKLEKTVKPENRETFIKESYLVIVMTMQEMLHKQEEKIIEEVSQLAKHIARTEFALMEFELFCTALPDKSIQKAEQSLKNYRKEKWKNTLSKSKSEEDALFSYDV